jgi:hypothetical protein
MTSARRTAVLVLVAAAGAAVIRAQAPRALPEQEALFKAVQDNLIRAERFDYQYAFMERRTEVHTNPFGRIGTGGILVSEIYPSPTGSLTYRRLIERNGVPLTPQQLAEQDREYQRRAAEVLRRLAAEQPDEKRRRESEAARAAERGQRRMTDILGALQFQVDGRTMHEGVPAIVVSFSPKPGARPQTRQGRTAQKFAGTVWIDEAASEVMRLEARAVDDISFGYGIVARLSKGTVGTLTRRPVGDGIWLPSRVTLKGRGRAVVFRTLVIDFAADWFDYRRFESDSPTPFLDARVERESRRRPQ